MGDPEKLLEEHWGLAEVIAIEYYNIPRSDLNEAISEAVQALNRAANSYNPQRGEFVSFATKVIRNALNTLYAKQLRMANVFPQSLESAPNWHDARADSHDSTSPVHKIEDATQNVRKKVQLRESSSVIEQVMNTLSPRERRVMEGIRLGFSLSEIGGKMGISKQAVHKISSGALAKLRLQLESLGYRGVDSYGLLKGDIIATRKVSG